MLRNMLMGLVVALAAGCSSGVGNDGAEVGGSCVVSSDCTVLSRCLTGPRWPGGHCAWSCDSTADCPDGSVCVESDGGICVVDCNECRTDDGYACVDYPARGAGGTVRGCGVP
ncbi:MAG: hypothetical protein KF729_06840 [Sandaracinaceae bacterium]|nr:hypothetical protein [Sandaracinaceae bacterium]